LLITRTFQPKPTAKIHVVHETRTRKIFGLASLCGNNYPGSTGLWTHKAPTCPACIKLDNPFELTTNQTYKFHRNTLEKTGSGLDDLIKRDVLVEAGQMTSRGEVLLADMQQHPPWFDVSGVVHARSGVAWKRAVCGADLVGLDKMTYSRLAKTLVLNKDLKVSCMECMLELP
jgi:hypothetical protein